MHEIVISGRVHVSILNLTSDMVCSRLYACVRVLQEFMVRLTIQQGRIGQILHVGTELLADESTSDDEAKQIEAQMALLNTHWEDLRIRAMDRQSRLVVFSLAGHW